MKVMSVQVLVCFLFVGLSVTLAFLVETVNDYDNPMNFSCVGNTTLRHLSSQHSNSHEDRVWSMGCYPAVAMVYDCQWTGYVNDFDQPFDYECPGEGFINGVRSIHDNGRCYRRWAFQCCYVNDFDQPFDYECPGEGFINGVRSIHDNGSEDRRWAFQCCKMKGKY
ncbi:hemagglutinin/amebocyte aggregation factor-like [Ylistrum balloti]|uniref:hemagglutinin/amebocyte aggregation factor-like n=1 Tax=Ylistrum balloti TaxID=509963 RepID=UPI0029058731|nr:hemagglutinin/amebocyte aggregation factor-like [Ylistrum balloti]